MGKNWAAHPYVGGAYSSMWPPGLATQYADAISEKVSSSFMPIAPHLSPIPIWDSAHQGRPCALFGLRHLSRVARIL